MSCELYNILTDNSLLSGTGPSCRYEKDCPQTSRKCKWGPVLRNIARNMALEDTAEDLEHDVILSELEAKVKHEAVFQDLRLESQINSLISISRAN